MKSFIDNIKQFPSAIFGSIMIILLVALAIYVVIAIPYRDAIYEWRGSEESRVRRQRMLAQHMLTGSGQKYSETILIDSTNPRTRLKTVTEVAATCGTFRWCLFDYPYDGFHRNCK